MWREPLGSEHVDGAKGGEVEAELLCRASEGGEVVEVVWSVPLLNSSQLPPESVSRRWKKASPVKLLYETSSINAAGYKVGTRRSTKTDDR